MFVQQSTVVRRAGPTQQSAKSASKSGYAPQSKKFPSKCGSAKKLNSKFGFGPKSCASKSTPLPQGFLALPAEIRNMTYEQVLEDYSDTVYASDFYLFEYGSVLDLPVEARFPALAFTNYQIYVEIMSLVFARREMVISDAAIAHFERLAKNLPHHMGYGLVRKILFNDFAHSGRSGSVKAPAWRVLEQATGLREVKIDMNRCVFYRKLESMDEEDIPKSVDSIVERYQLRRLFNLKSVEKITINASFLTKFKAEWCNKSWLELRDWLSVRFFRRYGQKVEVSLSENTMIISIDRS